MSSFSWMLLRKISALKIVDKLLIPLLFKRQFLSQFQNASFYFFFYVEMKERRLSSQWCQKSSSLKKSCFLGARDEAWGARVWSYKKLDFLSRKSGGSNLDEVTLRSNGSLKTVHLRCSPFSQSRYCRRLNYSEHQNNRALILREYD